MPEEILAIVIVSIVFGSLLSMMRMILAYRERTRTVSKSSGSGKKKLTTSELESMVNRAMSQAVEPLERRLAGIEDHLGSSALLLPEADRDHRLEEIETEEDEEEALGAARTSRSRRRT